mmetsp:Transcript_44723/g.83525  ORF Transcript_44723/g.83525 Transcript_44723/m.83525 type:complete len:440 (+) Transcript_44723:75-1394(+)
MDSVVSPATAFATSPGFVAPRLRATACASISKGQRLSSEGVQTSWATSRLAAGGLLGALAVTVQTRGPKTQRHATASQTQVVDVQDQADVQEEVETPPAPVVPLACPVSQRPLEVVPGGAVCEESGLGFPRSASGFLDLTIAAAKPAEDVRAAEAPAQASPAQEEPSLLQQLPFVEQTDALAGALGLPQSKEVEKLGRELLKEPQRLLNNPLQPAGTSTFQSPLVSFAYERGWRNSFASSGFPGPDEEFRLAQEFLREGAGLLGDTLLDASCGSGLFSRRFAASGDYSTVVALDFSESMLRQVDDFAKKEIGADYAEAGTGKTALKLVRADIARLPFESQSLGGVHAGAAIHCWPNPELAMAEISRVLRPGGVFVLTTFMPRGPLRAMGTNRNPYKFWTEDELRSLTSRCGLSDFKAIIKDPAFIMVRVKKPTLLAGKS